MKSFRRRSKGYLIELDQKSEFDHDVGGECHFHNSACPNCQRPLLQYLSLDTRDARLGLGAVTRSLPLLGCGRCALSWSPFVYRIADERGIEILQAGRGDDQYDEFQACVGSDRLTKRRVGLRPIPQSIEALYDLLNNNLALSEAQERHIADFIGRYAKPEVGAYPIVDTTNQVGGRAFLQQRLDDPRCHLCQNEMAFLACLCNDERSQFKIGMDDEQIIFFFCDSCLCVRTCHSA